MSQALQVVDKETQALMTREKVELIKQTIMKGASDTELTLFIDICNRTQLDPFARQIYAVPRYDNTLKKNIFTFQISIDGFRLQAQRSKRYRGQTEPQFCDDQGNWHDIWLKDEPPLAARVGVYHADFAQPLFAIAKYKNYVQTKQDGKPMAMWAKMPDHMLAKCAEALAIKKAFPYELSDLFTEEMMNVEKSVAAIEYDRQPMQSIAAKTRDQMTERERSIDDVRGFVKALNAMGDELFNGQTPEERTSQVLQQVHTLALERNWQYKTINGLSDLKNQHVADFAGWLEGRVAELQEKALEAEEDKLI